jgi:hypothetical protein
MNQRKTIMAGADLQRETDDGSIRGRNGVRLAHEGEGDLLNMPQTKGMGVPKVTRVPLVEWFVDAPFAVEVRAPARPRDPSTREMIRYVKLALGIFNNCSPGSFAGLHRNRRTRRLDG